MPKEIEIKFRIADLKTLTTVLLRTGFRQTTPSTHEINALYDLPGEKLRKKGELLRLRKYGESWTLTHKATGKSRITVYTNSSAKRTLSKTAPLRSSFSILAPRRSRLRLVDASSSVAGPRTS